MNVFLDILALAWRLLLWILSLPFKWFNRIFICSWKGHDDYYRGGGWIFHDSKPVKCDRCGRGRELQRLSD